MIHHLSDALINGNETEIQRILQDRPDLNQHDQYGTTPLINAILAQRAHWIEPLLKRGADPHYKDRSGLTPLFWAIENNQFIAIELLLKSGANPNDFTPTGQPVSAYALLRQHRPILDLLKRYGCDLDFAQDFIDIKLLGHRFELEGVTDYYAPSSNAFIQVSFEGFFLEFTIDIIRRSFQSFLESPAFKPFESMRSSCEHVIQALGNADTLRRFESRFINRKLFQKDILSCLNLDGLVLPVSYQGHAITFVHRGSYLAQCDRGELSLKEGSVNIYHMTRSDRFQADYIQELLYQEHDATFINLKMRADLGMKKIDSIPTYSQVAGNCSWANVEASIPTLLYLLTLPNNPLLLLEEEKRRHRESILWLHQAWIEWDKDQALSHLLERFHKTDFLPRKISYAMALAMLCFHRLSASSSKDLERSSTFLPLLTQPSYRHLLGSYLIHFKQASQTEDKHLYRNLLSILKHNRISPSIFTLV